MKRSLTLLLSAALSPWVAPAGAGAGACGVAELRQNAIIVRVAAGQTVEAFIDALEADFAGLAVEPADAIPGRPLHLLELFPPPEWGQAELDQLELALPVDYAGLILWGEFLYTDEAPEGSTGSTFVSSIGGEDLYQAQYAAQTIGSGAARQWASGAGVVVAVLDTGVDATHPLLAGRIAPGGADLVDGDGDPGDAADGLDNDGDLLVDEMAGHGTFVAGLVHLVAPEALILPVRVLDTEGRGDLWILAKGIFYAVDRGVEVVNVSVSSTYKSEAVEDAVDEAKSRGIVVVAAAGNCDTAEPEEHPAATSNVIGVAATDDADLKAGFSNFGEKLFLSAPGASALIAGEFDPERSIISAVPGGAFAWWAGTSMAAPLTAGTAALVRSQHPQWPAGESTFDEIELRLAASAVDIDAKNPQYAGLLGAGRLNTLGAVGMGPVAPAVGDLDASGSIGVEDLVILLAEWGLVHSSADLDGDGVVGILDLLTLLAAWG